MYIINIYYGMDAQITAAWRNVTHFIDFYSETTTVYAGDQLILSYLPNSRTLVFKPDSRPFPFSYRSYMTANRMELCDTHCQQAHII